MAVRLGYSKCEDVKDEYLDGEQVEEMTRELTHSMTRHGEDPLLFDFSHQYLPEKAGKEKQVVVKAQLKGYDHDKAKKEADSKTNDLSIQYVMTYIDMLVAAGDDEFPVMSSVLIKSGVATRKQLELIEKHGYIKSITIEVPSILVPGSTVPEKAYYTENIVPRLCQNSAPEPTDKVKLDLL